MNLIQTLEAIQGEAAAYCEDHDGCARIRQLVADAIRLAADHVPAEGWQQKREALAALAHEQWSGWMRYLFSRCVWDRCALLIPAEWEARWKRQMDTPYADLSEAEKESDRAEADRVLARLSIPLPAPPLPASPSKEPTA